MSVLTFVQAKTLAAVAVLSVPLVAYFIPGSGGDPLDQTIGNYGFRPSNPPSDLMDIGSLYYVSADGRFFTSVCHADEADVKGMTKHSNSVQLDVVDRLNQGVVAGVKSSLLKLLGTASSGGNQTEHFVLTDVSLDEISLEDIGEIYQKMLNKPDCNRAVATYVRADGYVCQEQKIMRAARFKLDKEIEWSHANKGTVNAGGVILKTQGEAEGSIVTQEQSAPDATALLTLGVAMAPLCMAPEDSRFPRQPPNGRWDQAYNFMLFRFVEPALTLFPTHRDEFADVASRQHVER